MLVGFVRHACNRKAANIAYHRIQVDPIRGDRKILSLHRERPEPAPQRRILHERVVFRSPRVEGGLEDRQVRPTVLHDPTTYPRQVRIPLRKPVKHASHARTETDNLVVRCVLADGSVGFGEGVPRDYVTGETIDSAIDLLRRSDGWILLAITIGPPR